MPKIALDEFDLKILSILQRSARITNLELAQQVGLSPTPCARRVRRLEEQGVIQSYVALCDREALGWGVSVFARVTLEKQDQETFLAFEEAVVKLPEVVACHFMSGDCDYQIRVVATHVEAYEDFLRNQLARIPGVASIRSNFALKRISYKIWLPLPSKPEPRRRRESDRNDAAEGSGLAS